MKRSIGFKRERERKMRVPEMPNQREMARVEDERLDRERERS
jgi:hypothetical protein